MSKIKIQYERFDGLCYRLVTEDVCANQLEQKIAYLKGQLGAIRWVKVKQ